MNSNYKDTKNDPMKDKLLVLIISSRFHHFRSDWTHKDHLEWNIWLWKQRVNTSCSEFVWSSVSSHWRWELIKGHKFKKPENSLTWRLLFLISDTKLQPTWTCVLKRLEFRKHLNWMKLLSPWVLSSRQQAQIRKSPVRGRISLWSTRCPATLYLFTIK